MKFEGNIIGIEIKDLTVISSIILQLLDICELQTSLNSIRTLKSLIFLIGQPTRKHPSKIAGDVYHQIGDDLASEIPTRLSQYLQAKTDKGIPYKVVCQFVNAGEHQSNFTLGFLMPLTF